MKYIFKLVFFILFTSCVRVDESMQLFFPKDLKELQFVQTQFSAFWWNFIIIENDSDLVRAQKICSELKAHVGKELRMAFCGSSLASAGPVLKSWSEDLVYRQKFDLAKLKQYVSTLSASTMQASFVSDPGLFAMLRYDPFQTWQDYLELSKNSLFDAFEKKQGYLYDLKTNRVIIPIQFQMKPELAHIEPIMTLLKDFPEAFMIGSHGATYRNEKQVRDDLELISLISLVVFILFLVFLVLKSRVNTFLLIIPVSIAIYGAALITQWIDGSVHGLTLAFGSCIVGLALDYGLHGAFGSENKQTWTSNTIGLLTTLSGICILIFSGIPLMRQMMLFSSMGLGLGFLFFYLVFRHKAEFFKIKSIDFVLPQIKGSQWVILLLALISFYGASRAELTMDLRKLSFVSEKESRLTTWFFSQGNDGDAFLLIRPFSLMKEDLFSEKAWADSHHVHYEGLSKYFPGFQLASENFNSWSKDGCDFMSHLGSVSSQKMFLPYSNYICDLKKSSWPPDQISLLKERSYMQHLFGEKHLLSIFNAKDQAQAEQIQAQFPQAKSLSQGVKNFSISLEKDLRWMMPASLLLTLLILIVYYRQAKPVFTALLPFFSGLGLYFAAGSVFGFEIDLISILGLVMVFGFSIDYGVFSTDVHQHQRGPQEVNSVYSALTFAAITNILGFLPMLFAGHPVLARLGAALFFGTVGTYLGTVYGVYPLYEKKEKV